MVHGYWQLFRSCKSTRCHQHHLVLYHCRALPRHRSHQIIAATRLYELTGSVVAPAMDIEVQSVNALADASL
jgi:hypothetical protein